MATAFAVLIITRRPFRDGWKNVVAVVIWVVACIQLLVNFISTLGVGTSCVLWGEGRVKKGGRGKKGATACMRAQIFEVQRIQLT